MAGSEVWVKPSEAATRLDASAAARIGIRFRSVESTLQTTGSTQARPARPDCPDCSYLPTKSSAVCSDIMSPAHAPDPAAPPGGQLLRILGAGFGIAVIIGGTIGVGILRTP